jgi:hypothetical protein
LDFSQKGFICGISNLQRDEESDDSYLVIFNLDSNLGIIASAENKDRDILITWLQLIKERNGIKEDTPAIHNYLVRRFCWIVIDHIFFSEHYRRNLKCKENRHDMFKSRLRSFGSIHFDTIH